MLCCARDARRGEARRAGVLGNKRERETMERKGDKLVKTDGRTASEEMIDILRAGEAAGEQTNSQRGRRGD